MVDYEEKVAAIWAKIDEKERGKTENVSRGNKFGAEEIVAKVTLEHVPFISELAKYAHREEDFEKLGSFLDSLTELLQQYDEIVGWLAGQH